MHTKDIQDMVFMASAILGVIIILVVNFIVT